MKSYKHSSGLVVILFASNVLCSTGPDRLNIGGEDLEAYGRVEWVREAAPDIRANGDTSLHCAMVKTSDPGCLTPEVYKSARIEVIRSGLNTRGYFLLLPKAENIAVGDLVHFVIVKDGSRPNRLIELQPKAGHCTWLKNGNEGKDGGVVCDSYDYRKALKGKLGLD